MPSSKNQIAALVAVWCVASVTACAAGDGGDSGFGGSFDPGASQGQVSTAAATDGSSGGASSGDSGGDTGGGGTGGIGTSGMVDGGTDTGMTSAGADTFPPMESSSGGDGTDPTAEESSSDDGGVPAGSQPASGMWAHCTEADSLACGVGAPTCVFLDDNGFCSDQGCINPAVDCAPAPAGTSVVPICADAVVTAICGLDCSVAACPTGMDCTLVSINMGPDYMLCI